MTRELAQRYTQSVAGTDVKAPSPAVGNVPAAHSPENGTARTKRGAALTGRSLERFAIVIVWGLMIGIYSILEPHTFDSAGTFQTIFGSQTALVFLTMAVLCTMVIGEFVDLSIAAVLGLTATIVPVLTIVHHMNVWLACLIALVAAVAAGAVNAVLVVVVGVDVIIVTLGMSTLLLGIALWVSGLNDVSGLSQSFGAIANESIGGLPISFYYGVAIALLFAYILAYTPLGRHMRFVGANREVSRLAGVPVNRIRFGAFIVSAALSGIGGIIVAASLGGFDPNSSVTYLLPTFSAAFLGTAVIQPGTFNPIGGLVGVYFLSTGILGLQELGYGGWVADVFYGVALVLAVTISTLLRRKIRGTSR